MYGLGFTWRVWFAAIMSTSRVDPIPLYGRIGLAALLVETFKFKEHPLTSYRNLLSHFNLDAAEAS